MDRHTEERSAVDRGGCPGVSGTGEGPAGHSEDIQHPAGSPSSSHMYSSEKVVHPPPDVPQQLLEGAAPPPCPPWEGLSLSEDDARRALIQYVSDKSFYCKKAAMQASITSIQDFHTYRYCLETHTETRSTERTVSPYYGQKLDNDGDLPPGPWEIYMEGPPLFWDSTTKVDVPNTSAVRVCAVCSEGRTMCTSCFGRGRKTCMGCGGGGRVYAGNLQICWACSGQGTTRCYICSGEGKVECRFCAGKKKVVDSITLTITWKKYEDKEIMTQSSGLKMSKLDMEPGKMLMTHVNHKIQPITDFPEPDVVQTSKRLMSEHEEKFRQTARVLQQRQTVELVPVFRVTYHWRGQSRFFFVYGTNQKVKVMDYPACSCCCCSLM